MISNTHHHHHRQQQVSLAGRRFRCFLTWFFFSLLLLYVLYTSKLILLPPNNCPQTSDDHHHRFISEKYPNVSIVGGNGTHSLYNFSRSNYSSSNAATSLALYGGGQELAVSSSMYPIKYERYDTKIEDIVFCIAAASNLWDRRKEYIKTWWRPNVTRGVVWLDEEVRTLPDEPLPETRVSGDTSKFRYTNQQGQRSALRLSRAVSETLRLGVKDVKWFVMGDDDTVFAVDNLVRVLSKYDHTQFYYIGSSSESHIQNIFFSYGMAFGGGGFAISYPLAKELEKMQDRCIQRYPGLYGSDDRMQACMSELGVPLSKELGFHQFDVYGNLLGLLGAHPIAPFVSLHHLDVVDPVFPGMTKVRSIKHLFHHSKDDYASMMQQSICYDRQREWSISVSWGYVVQIIRGVMSPRELEMPTRTFLNWYTKGDFTAYAFNTRPVTRHPCQKPFVYYIRSSQHNQRRKQIVGVYSRHRQDSHPMCRWRMESPERTETIVVVKRPDSQRWQKSPRRDCCRVIPSNKRSQMHIWVGSCREGEISEL